MASGSTFLTAKARVLLALCDDCDARMRDLAAAAGVTERAAYDIVCDLVAAGYITRDRNGRRNCYRLHPERSPDASQERLHALRLAAALKAAAPA